MDPDLKDPIQNLYHEILGTRESKIAIISQWIEAIQKSNMDPTFMVRLALEDPQYQQK